jgi:transposase
MQTVTTIGLDIAKSAFQVHGIDAEGKVIIRRQLKRRYVMTFFQKLSPCLVGIEACATSHHWSRKLKALGHTVRLMTPAYVKPYVKREKNDATDAKGLNNCLLLSPRLRTNACLSSPGRVLPPSAPSCVGSRRRF